MGRGLLGAELSAASRTFDSGVIAYGLVDADSFRGAVLSMALGFGVWALSAVAGAIVVRNLSRRLV